MIYSATRTRIHLGASTYQASAAASQRADTFLTSKSSANSTTSAAPITLARYTHALPDHIEHERKQLTAYLATRQREHASNG